MDECKPLPPSPGHRRRERHLARRARGGGVAEKHAHHIMSNSFSISGSMGLQLTQHQSVLGGVTTPASRLSSKVFARMILRRGLIESSSGEAPSVHFWAREC